MVLTCPVFSDPISTDQFAEESPDFSPSLKDNLFSSEVSRMARFTVSDFASHSGLCVFTRLITKDLSIWKIIVTIVPHNRVYGADRPRHGDLIFLEKLNTDIPYLQNDSELDS